MTDNTDPRIDAIIAELSDMAKRIDLDGTPSQIVSGDELRVIATSIRASLAAADAVAQTELVAWTSTDFLSILTRNGSASIYRNKAPALGIAQPLYAVPPRPDNADLVTRLERARKALLAIGTEAGDVDLPIIAGLALLDLGQQLDACIAALHPTEGRPG